MAATTSFKGLCLLTLPFVCLSIFAQNNTETKLIGQQSNGVKVYEQTGVQSTSSTLEIEQSREVRTLSDWTIDECELAIDQINQKITQLTEAEENPIQLTAYREEIERIKKHLSTITK